MSDYRLHYDGDVRGADFLYDGQLRDAYGYPLRVKGFVYDEGEDRTTVLLDIAVPTGGAA